MRKIIHNLLTTDAELAEDLDPANVKGSSSLQNDNAPPRPFAVLRYGLTTAGVAHIKRSQVTIWIHDEPGTYERIDRILARIEAILDGKEHVTNDSGEELVLSDWDSRSGDLYDTGYKTICRTSSFNLVGTGV